MAAARMPFVSSSVLCWHSDYIRNLLSPGLRRPGFGVAGGCPEGRSYPPGTTPAPTWGALEMRLFPSRGSFPSTRIFTACGWSKLMANALRLSRTFLSLLPSGSVLADAESVATGNLAIPRRFSASILSAAVNSRLPMADLPTVLTPVTISSGLVNSPIRSPDDDLRTLSVGHWRLPRPSSRRGRLAPDRPGI